MLPLQELQQKRAQRAQKVSTAERGPPENPLETRVPGMRRPAQEPSPALGGTAYQALKANNAGESGSVATLLWGGVGYSQEGGAAPVELPWPPVLLPMLPPQTSLGPLCCSHVGSPSPWS
ncbi:hypothetical protein P7K49_012058 [Saguinus oedipus]|uniref:Uncharacterized protein n=1 Tax=Saguinus oedipus TaxID=9490 RepID=A0ABQ9VT42_SAGOE|nr:hypothetical protein P7K49_012058 [Saguinus oedipus]